MKCADFVYYFVSQKSAAFVFIKTFLTVENYFSEILLGVLNNSDLWDMDLVYYFTSLL